MKVLFSRRQSLPRLNICLVFCCLTLLALSGCNARIIAQDVGASKVEEVLENLTKDTLKESSLVDEGLKSVQGDDVINEKRLRRVTEILGKSTTENEDAKIKIKPIGRVTENDKGIQADETDRHMKALREKPVSLGQQRGPIKFLKNPIRRQKRDDQNVKEEKQEDIKSANVKSGINNSAGQSKITDVEGIRRLDVVVEDDDKKHVRTVSEDIAKPVEINSNIDGKVETINIVNVEQARSQENEKDSKIIESKLSAGLPEEINIKMNPTLDSSQSAENILLRSAVATEEKIIHENLENTQEKSVTAEDPKIASNRADNYPILQIIKGQALELQQKIRNSTFVKNFKGQMSGNVLPNIPIFSDNQFLEILKSILTKKNIEQPNEIDSNVLKNSGFNDKQMQIISCAQQLFPEKERQSFVDNMSECVQNLNVRNCMRIFIYPIIVENMPEVLTRTFSNLPIEINIPDLLQGNRDKPKSARQVPILGFYSNMPVDPDALIYNILRDGLLKNPPNENLLSYIDEKNETLSKLLTCNRLKLLQMTEKYLPENMRQGYSDQMLSCLRRFEYFSCMKYFSWPALKQYYPALPQFPLSDAHLTSLTYPTYPLITYPGYETGLNQLPEIIDSAPRFKPDEMIMNILQKTMAEHPRIVTLPTPIQLDLIFKTPYLTQEQLASIHVAEQLLPVQVRSEYVLKTVQCIKQFDYYNCMKYVTWPLVKQSNPSLPQFPNWQDILNFFNIPDIPQLQNFFNFISQFQFPQFSLPTFQLPNFQNFSLPDFSALNPFAQPTTTTTAAPPTTPSGSSSTDGKKVETALESRIFRILKEVRDSMGATPLSPATYTNRKLFLFPLMTEEQSKIFALAEGIVPPIAREPLITSMYFCLNNKNDFSTCSKIIIWPSIRSYVKGLPDFPDINEDLTMQLNAEAISPFTADIIGANGDNFLILRVIEKFFIEGREDAISYIIRSIQLSSPDSLNMPKILDILRSIQYNAPDFVNMQIPEYSRTPELSLNLNAKQENIVHTVKSLIPQEVQSKFYNDMMECAQKNKFSFCSRNVIYPYIYPYFQKALTIPKIEPVQIEANINAEFQKENILPAIDKIDPESTIMSMLRKVQISTPSLPNPPKESIAYTPEFKQMFSARQAQILTLAENILPDEYRKGFLEEIYKCIQGSPFLDCARNSMFPVISKVYPDFPEFPEFNNLLEKTSARSVLENIKSTSTERSYTLKKIIPSMDTIFKFLPSEKTNSLQILIDRLPDYLYYDLYVKMAQCTQYSNSISCGQDIIYPVLKQYYDEPEFSIDDYYPLSLLPFPPATLLNQKAAYDYELICENMGFTCTLIPLGSNLNTPFKKSEMSLMPFGKLADGSRIFKRSQDIWNLNLTPSVGADKSSSSEFSSQSSTNLINFLKFKLPTKFDEHLIQRSKRNVDDLYDSYSDAIPDNKKNSVPRRIPPKLSFPNVTETELLQILIYLRKLSAERTTNNGNIVLDNYFVDTLNETDRALLTADQYEILKLVQGLNSETSRAGFMARLVRCIRTLSLIRCVGIFVWPSISSNLPSLPFNLQEDSRSNRAAEEKSKIQELFGVSPTEFENQLLSRKNQIESNFIDWYKSLTENKFEFDVGPLKITGHGDGELAVTFSGFREGRLSKIKDNKNLPSILTIISEVIEEVFDTKLSKTKNKKENSRKDKRDRSLHRFQESNFENFIKTSHTEKDSQRSDNDDQVINILLEKLRPSISDVKMDDLRHYYNLDDAYRAFQMLFGPKLKERIDNKLKASDTENLKKVDGINFDELKDDDDLKLVPFQEEDKDLEEFKLTSRAMISSSENVPAFSKLLVENIKKFMNINKKRFQKELIVRLPKLNDELAVGRKFTSSISNMGKGMKNKMGDYLPAAGVAASFVIQLALAHAKAASSVAEILSNMALGSAMVGMVRDMLFGSNNQPNVKVIYDTEKVDSGISWPTMHSESTISFTPPSTMYGPSPHFH